MSQPSPAAWHQRIRRIGQVKHERARPHRARRGALGRLLCQSPGGRGAGERHRHRRLLPTSVPDFRPAKHLGGRDLFGECARAARKRGIRVIARMSRIFSGRTCSKSTPTGSSGTGRAIPWSGRPRGSTAPACTPATSTSSSRDHPRGERALRSGCLLHQRVPGLHGPGECWCRPAARCPRTTLPVTTNAPEQDHRYLAQVQRPRPEGHPDSVYFANLGQGIDAFPISRSWPRTSRSSTATPGRNAETSRPCGDARSRVASPTR